MNKEEMMETFKMSFYWVSRYWNRIIFFFLLNDVKMCKALIWDYTGKNGWLLKDINVDKFTKDILCETNSS